MESQRVGHDLAIEQKCQNTPKVKLSPDLFIGEFYQILN